MEVTSYVNFDFFLSVAEIQKVNTSFKTAVKFLHQESSALYFSLDWSHF